MSQDPEDGSCISKDSSLEDMPPEAKKLKIDSSATDIQDCESVAENVDSTENSGDIKGQSETAAADPLSYTRGKEFTSEIFKIQIHNLPRFGFGVSFKLFFSAFDTLGKFTLCFKLF